MAFNEILEKNHFYNLYLKSDAAKFSCGLRCRANGLLNVPNAFGTFPPPFPRRLDHN